MDTTFIRKDFYIAPPARDASPDEWAAWLKADAKGEAQAKRKHTRAQKACELPDNAQSSSMRRVGGVWKQSTPIGFTGDAEHGGQLEPSIEAHQERDYILARMTGTVRGAKKLLSRGDKQRRRRQRRKERKGQ